MPGNNANAGTSPNAPKRDLAGFPFNTVPAGTQLLFARGGVWNHTMIRLENLNATPANPLVFDTYGSGAAPVWKTAANHAIEFGGWQNTTNDGGYTIRNLKLDGLGTAEWGLWLRDNLRNVTVENVEITGFTIGIHSQSVAPHGVTRVAIRNSRITRNRTMGFLGSFNDSVIEGSTFEGNNFAGSVFHHAIYMSGNAYGGRNNVVRNNTFTRNSVVNGECTGGNVTFHGQMDGMLIEGNLIEQDSSTGGCYGFSITTGYDTAEWFRNFVVRNNTVVNLGNCSVCVNAAPGIVVENNKFIKAQATYHAGVSIGGDVGAGDAADRDAIVRNNVACFPAAGAYQMAANVNSPGAQVSGNVVYTGAAALSGVCAR